jgi:hypothetical protein
MAVQLQKISIKNIEGMPASEAFNDYNLAWVSNLSTYCEIAVVDYHDNKNLLSIIVD